MPLDANRKRMRPQLNGFDGSVGSFCTDTDIFSGTVDGLVMIAVYENPGTDVSSEQTSRLSADQMADLSSGGGLLHVVQRAAGDQGKILPYSSPTGNA